MAIEVQMTEDLRKRDSKVIGPFNLRQIKCIPIAVVCAIPAMIIPDDIAMKILLGFLFAAPALLCGWIKLDGMYFETLLLRFLYLHVLSPSRRKYKSHNTYRTLLNEMNKRAEQERIKNMPAKERKKYLKAKKKKEVQYSKLEQYRIYH